eukprot:8065144-Karenia_brevis.AAC.1
MDLKWTSVWRARSMDSNGKQKNSAGGQHEIAENLFKADLNMEIKVYGIQMENKSILLGDSAKSQKMDLKWTSVWRAKGREF